MDLMLFDSVIAFDHYRQKVLLITGVLTGEEPLKHAYDRAVQKLAEMAALLQNGEPKQFKKLKLTSKIQPQFPKEKYCEMVEKAKHYIHEGDIFQVVLSNPMRAKAEGSLFDTYRALRATNPSPYMFYFSSDDIELAGASPETLAKLDRGQLSTFPLAGTRPRGKTRQEDEASGARSCWLMRRSGRNTICSSIWAETISEKSAKSGPCRWKNIWRSSAFPTLCTSVQRLPA